MRPVDEEEIARLARELPQVKLARPDLERIRSELMRAVGAEPARSPAHSNARRPGWIAGAAAAAMFLLALLLAKPPRSVRTEPVHEVPKAEAPAEAAIPSHESHESHESHAQVAVLRSARLDHRHPSAGEELVELQDGRVRFEVEKLDPGERFRVQAGDAEVEVRGTSFDVDVVQGILQEVVVHRGEVAVTRDGLSTILRVGDRWPPPARKTVPPSDPQAVPSDRSWSAGWNAMRRSDDRAAARAFERTATDGPLAEDAAFWQAVALAKSGQSASARDAFLRFLERFPDSPRRAEASVIVAWHLIDEDPERAKNYFEIGRLDPNPEVRTSAQAGLDAVEAGVASKARSALR